jgi:hypothetical protein
MKLLTQIVVDLLEDALPHRGYDSLDYINTTSFRTLEQIQQILLEPSMSDFDCIEKIVCLLEDLGLSCGERHDFG